MKIKLLSFNDLTSGQLFMMKNILLLPLILISNFAVAQSILSNGSFEDIRDCPNKAGSIDLAVGWYSITDTPDLFGKCAKGKDFGVPSNYVGHIEAFDGNNYAGIVVYMKQPNKIHITRYDYVRQENIFTILTNKTKAGSAYVFTLQYALADSSDYYTNNLSLTLSNSPPENDGVGANVQIISINIDNPLTRKWEFAKSSFVASGNWKYATIGYSRKLLSINNYKHYIQKKKTMIVTKHSNKACFYYLDNLSLVSTTRSNTLKSE